MARLALRLRAAASRHTLAGAPARLDVGLHCGPVAGAVVGAHRALPPGRPGLEGAVGRAGRRRSGARP